MAEARHYHVYFNHNEDDAGPANEIARLLRDQYAIQVWLRAWSLVPGRVIQKEQEQGLAQSDACVILIGEQGVQDWQELQVYAAIQKRVDTEQGNFPVIAVFLPSIAERKIVSLPATLQLFAEVRFTALDDMAAIERLVAGIRGELPLSDTYTLPNEPAPYLGLLPFEKENTRFFFGRESDERLLLKKMSQNAFVAVVGSSGSGKSSLVRAGVLPKLEENALTGSRQWYVRIMKPGAQPIDALAAQLATLVAVEERLAMTEQLAKRLHQQSDGLRTALLTLLAGRPRPFLLVIDQFEELFTHSGESTRVQRNSQAEQFIANLADAVGKGKKEIRVLITVRADFMEKCLIFSSLRDLLQDRQVLLGPMNEASLRDVILRPAKAVRAYFEKGLVEIILRDVASEPGALPLLEHALFELWQARHGPWMTLEAYQASGGVEGALKRRAQDTYEALTPEQQRIARNIFIRLTTQGEGIAYTRQRVQRSELNLFGVEQEQVDAVLEALSGFEARLIVVDKETVELAHEALIRHWPTLQEWLSENEAGVRLHSNLRLAVREWERLARDASALYRGLRLEQAQEWAAENAHDLNETERLFLDESSKERDRLQQQEAFERARLRDAVRMGAVRLFTDNPAQRAALLREFEWPVEAYGWMAAAAETLREAIWKLEAPDDGGGWWLSLFFNRSGKFLATRRLAHHFETWIWEVGQIGMPTREIPSEVPAGANIDVQNVWLAYDDVADQFIRLLPNAELSLFEIEAGPDIRESDNAKDTVEYSPEEIRTHYQQTKLSVKKSIQGFAKTFDPEKDLVTAMGYSARARRMLSVHADRSLRLWNIAHPQKPKRLAIAAPFKVDESLAISPDGKWAVLKNRENLLNAVLIEIASKQSGMQLPLGTDVMAVAFHPDSSWLAAVHSDGKLRLWSLDGVNHLRQREFQIQSDALFALAFSPDGRSLAIGTNYGILYLLQFNETTLKRGWEAPASDLETTLFNKDGMSIVRSTQPTPTSIKLQVHTSGIHSIIFDPSGTWLVITAYGSETTLLRADGAGVFIPLHGHQGTATVAFSPDGHWLATASPDTLPRLWSMDWAIEPQIITPPPWPLPTRVDRLVVEHDSEVEVLWTRWGRTLRRSTLQERAPSPTFNYDYHGHYMSSRLYFDPNLHWYLQQPEGGECRFFPLRGEQRPFVLEGVQARLVDLAVTADDKWILGVFEDGSAYLWGAADPTAPARFGSEEIQFCAVAFDGGGQRAVTACDDGLFCLWDLSNSQESLWRQQSTLKADKLQFSPDGQWLLAKGQGRAFAIVQFEGADKPMLFQAKDVQFVRQGAMALAVFSDSICEIGKENTLRFVRRFSTDPGEVCCISPGGEWILTQRRDAEPQLWSTYSNLEAVTLRGAGTAGVTAAAASPDGKRLYTSHGNGSVLVWTVDLDPDSLRTRLWRATTHCLSVPERQELLAEEFESAIANRAAAVHMAEDYGAGQ